MEKVSIQHRTWMNWKGNAQRKGIEVSLSFAEWWAIWSPHWEFRERLNLRMVRYCGIGPYSVGNTHITTQLRHCQSLAEFRRFIASRAQEVRLSPQIVDNNPLVGG